MIDTAQLSRLLTQHGFNETGAKEMLPLAQSIWREAQKSPAASEPVRWMCPDYGDVSTVARLGWQPLYTAPPTALIEAARQALDALNKCRDWPGAYEECNGAVIALRAALKEEA